jgi:serine/threonine protein kinase
MSSRAFGVERLEAACASIEGHALSSRFWQHVVARFEALLEVATALSNLFGADFVCDVQVAVAELLHEVELRRRDDFPPWWIAANHRNMVQCYRAHTRIDALCKVVGAEGVAGLANWRSRFRDDRLEQERYLEERLELSSDAMLFGDIVHSSNHSQLLDVLAKQPKEWPSSLSKDIRATDPIRLELSVKVARLMEQTAVRIRKYTEAHRKEVSSAVQELFDESRLRLNLRKVSVGCKEVQGGFQLCLRASKRLDALMEVLLGAKESQRELVADAFTTAVDEFLFGLRLRNDYSNFLDWVATCQRQVAQVVHTHKRVDAIFAALGIEEDVYLSLWRDNLAADRMELEGWLEEKLTSKKLGAVVDEAHNTAMLPEIQALLANQLMVWPVVSPDGSESFPEELTLSLKQAEFMKATLESVSKLSQRPDAFDWFVTRGDVDVDKKTRRESPSGTMYEGTWVDIKTGKRCKVAVKFLDMGKTTLGKRVIFSREISSWSNLENKHEIKMLGANHCSNPMFFITELATEGNFVDFFLEEENRVLLWRLFIQAAQGLRNLHKNNVEHGNIRCSNILLIRPEGGDDSKLVVKLSDFGMTHIRTESITLCDTDNMDAMRFSAPERLAQTTMRVDFSRADTYSLGLCIIDAATGEPPFGTLDDDEVIASKLSSEPIKRPEEGFTNAEWDLVASMCENDPLKRPSLDEVIEKMEELDRVRDLKLLCPSCHERVRTDYSFCGWCSAAVSLTPAVA